MVNLYYHSKNPIAFQHRENFIIQERNFEKWAVSDENILTKESTKNVAAEQVLDLRQKFCSI